ncbi:MAG: NADH-quinone oxidoreductase subunit J [Alphaproteobacteria bacterium]
MFIQAFAFYLFAIAAILGALGVISAKNPVISVLLMVWTFFSAAGLFIIQGAEFLGFLLVIVYVGAIAVLFLFIVMMLNIDYVQLREGFVKNIKWGILVGIGLAAELITVIFASRDQLKMAKDIPAGEDNIVVIGSLLYNEYMIAFWIAGVVLLVALVGAVMLTHRRRADVKRQDPVEQAMVQPEDRLVKVKAESGKGIG